MTASRCCCKWFQMCSSGPLVVESTRALGGWATSSSRDACGISVFSFYTHVVGMRSAAFKGTLEGQSLSRVPPVTVSFPELTDVHSCAADQGTKDCLCLLLVKPYFSLCTITSGPAVSHGGRGSHADPKEPSRLSCLRAQGREFLLVILMSGLIPPPAVPSSSIPALVHSWRIFHSGSAIETPNLGARRLFGHWLQAFLSFPIFRKIQPLHPPPGAGF